jgi:hypothetical protein
VYLLAGGFEDRSHWDENIWRFYPGSLRDYFFPDSGLVYDSELGRHIRSRDSVRLKIDGA